MTESFVQNEIMNSLKQSKISKNLTPLRLPNGVGIDILTRERRLSVLEFTCPPIIQVNLRTIITERLFSDEINCINEEKLLAEQKLIKRNEKRLASIGYKINGRYNGTINDITLHIVQKNLLYYLLQVDATFKLTWQELPLLVFGCSDADRHFHPYGIALISTDEAASSYARLFQTLKQTVLNTTGSAYDVKYLMGDGGKGISCAAKTEFPNARRLMCWFHVIKKCRDHRKMVPVARWPAVERDIVSIQLSFSDAVFWKAISLLLTKWRQQPEIVAFANYFETQKVKETPSIPLDKVNEHFGKILIL
ncbi:unnamed protein product [Didymodactylos carnosus]|uniref:MULE transposase domain-containing protein n=1 Tax=Didymodactylos carnosus TaxID=1234261 RepID=A0A8S2HER9_9BILA|nr:unnamed protein product [Didymodactylos carnosus]CAF3636907.1 unnamed protein product [Didymodactylos carnosus]